MPLWLLLTVMALTTYRATRLINKDTFPPVLWLRDTLAGGWRPLTEPEMGRIRDQANNASLTSGPGVVPPEDRLYWPTQNINGAESRYVKRASWSPYWLAELVSCPWCCSGWVAGAVTLATDLAVGLPDPWLVGPAVWGAAALLASRSWS